MNKPNPPFEPDRERKGGIYVLSPEGELLTFLPVPRDEVTNCAFGGDDLKTLYITAGGTLYSIRTSTPGHIVPHVLTRLPGHAYSHWRKRRMDDRGQAGWHPCSFVVGKDGKIAYIGHPMYLDEVLPKVVAGKWNAEDVKGMAKVEADWNKASEALRSADTAEGLKVLADFERNHPRLAAIPYFVGPKISLLLKAKKVPEALTYAKEVIARATKSDNSSTLLSIADALRSPSANKDKELLSLSLSAALAALRIGGEKDAFAVLNVAQTYKALGDQEKAKEYGEKAIAASAGEGDGRKNYIKQQVKLLEEPK